MTMEHKVSMLTALVKLAVENAQLKETPGTGSGAWTKRKNGWGYACSECSGTAPMQYKYCPHCGCGMDGGNANA